MLHKQREKEPHWRKTWAKIRSRLFGWKSSSGARFAAPVAAKFRAAVPPAAASFRTAVLPTG